MDLIFTVRLAKFHDLFASATSIRLASARAFPAYLAFSSARLPHLSGIFQVLLVSFTALRFPSV